MPRPATGQVIVDERRRSATFGLRFRAYGKREYMTLGTAKEGWTRAKAETELQNILADVRRGIWQPPVVEVVQAPRAMPTFHEFASEWFERQILEGGQRGEGLSEAGKAALGWVISNHLLPAFALRRLDQITVEDVDRYQLGKVREGKLSATSINKTLATLAAILESAVEYELIDRNPARGRRRRLPTTAPRRTWLDRADHIAALLDAAGQRDQKAKVCRGQRRALLATLVFAGLRIGEALSLRWRDLDLARGTISVRDAKTDAGVRIVNILPILRDELGAYRARLDPTAAALVFGTATGHRQGATNVRRRVLAKAVEQANRQLTEDNAEPLPTGLTPHSLRRTFASLLFAIGETPPYVMAQMGHTTPNLTLAIYARQMNRRDGEPERLKVLVEGRDSAAASNPKSSVARSSYAALG
ncbi:MAG TPA: tyrosine-type recombinase/integrase [Solirubrobacteraceae bacterium]|jgi:integrase|nr:tyrosine-type recombinase/integrase [Solirubrobacteraceae bacterium]